MNNILKMSPDGIILYSPEDNINWETVVKEQKAFLQKINDEVNAKLKETPMTSLEIDRWLKERLEIVSQQIGIVAGFLDAVFDRFNLSCLTGASIIKKEDIKNEN